MRVSLLFVGAVYVGKCGMLLGRPCFALASMAVRNWTRPSDPDDDVDCRFDHQLGFPECWDGICKYECQRCGAQVWD